MVKDVDQGVELYDRELKCGASSICFAFAFRFFYSYCDLFIYFRAVSTTLFSIFQLFFYVFVYRFVSVFPPVFFFLSFQVYTWGDKENGVVGHTNADGHQYLPRMLESLQAKTVKQVAACGFHTAALTDAGEIFTWGEGKGFVGSVLDTGVGRGGGGYGTHATVKVPSFFILRLKCIPHPKNYL